MNDIESPIPVAYLGPEGTYTHTALRNFFGLHQTCSPEVEIQDVFSSVENGTSQYGVVPVENSTEGSIGITLDCIKHGSLKVCGEILLRIHHSLMSGPGTDSNSLTKIVSHQQSLGQCRKWLSEHFPEIELISVSSNAEAAKISANTPGVAAIAGRNTAQLYGLNILAENIEDDDDNTTRFWVLNQHQRTSPTGSDKTSIVISANDEPGTLFKALEPFHRFDVSLNKLESRPSRKSAWSYSFFVDFAGHISEQKVQDTLAELESHSLDVKILGSYPTANY